MADKFVLETSYEDETEVRWLALEDLTARLCEDIEHGHYSGDRPEVKGIWRYVSPGQLQELVLVSSASGADEDDWMYFYYAIHEKADYEGFGPSEENKVASFTVRIDGRA